MGKLVNLAGKRYGRLVVMRRSGTAKNGEATWLCKCDCGREVVIQGNNLRIGHTKSCGCLSVDATIQRSKKQNETRIKENLVYVKFNNIDAEFVADLDIWNDSGASEFCWMYKDGYAVTNIPNPRKIVPFHRYAFRGCPDGLVVDHINGDRLDNRKKNIRFVTIQQNNQNRSARHDNPSGHVGVVWNKEKGMWRAQIGIGRKTYHLGYFTEIADAVKARKQGEMFFFGDYRRMGKLPGVQQSEEANRETGF